MTRSATSFLCGNLKVLSYWNLNGGDGPKTYSEMVA